MERTLNFKDDLGEGKFFIDFRSQDSQPNENSTEDTQNITENNENGKYMFLKK